jgi:hypothetical protein
MADEVKQEQPIENENTIETPKEKLPIYKVVSNQVVSFVDKNGYSSLAIGAGICVGIFLFVKYKIKK